MTLSGSATPAQYQTALQSITYSTTSTSTVTRNISLVVTDSNDTGPTPSNTATTQIVVSAPITISALYVNGSGWGTFDTYLGGHGEGSTTLGYTMLTGASQTKPIPWSTINQIDVQFSGALSATPSATSFKLTGGTGGAGHAAAAPSVTSVTSLGGNAYRLTLSGSLGYNNYILSIASSSTVFGPAVTDANGAGISGLWTNSSSTFPSGNGLAGSQFNFLFDVLPGDADQSGTTNCAGQRLGDEPGQRQDDRVTSALTARLRTSTPTGRSTRRTTRSAPRTSTSSRRTSPIRATLPAAWREVRALRPWRWACKRVGRRAVRLARPAFLGRQRQFARVFRRPSPLRAARAAVVGQRIGQRGSSTATGRDRDHGRHSFAAIDKAVSEFDLADLGA